jgi:serine-type D-Ala-D-Ala carboxypeptidase/endopeptidase (penicillin-binding protein 4)
MHHRLAIHFFVLVSCGFAQGLAGKVDALAAALPVASRGHWGAQVIDLATGELIYARNENSFFVPASNTKLFSTALALMRLGPAHRQLTRLVGMQPLGPDGVLHGELRLIGGGDATLSGRPLPYDPKAKFGEPLAALDELAEQAWQSGLRRVDGDIAGDDTLYLWEPFPGGWALDDTKFSYGAPVSALMLHDNTVTLRLEGGAEAGQPVRVTVSPTPAYWTIESRVRTAFPAAGAHMEREPGSRQIELWGTIAPRRARVFSLAVDDPAHYAAFAMREALERRGIAVLGGVAAYHRHPLMKAGAETVGAVELARRLSPPLLETLRVIDKESQNLQAEAVLLEVARLRGKAPGRDGAVEELRAFLEEIGVPGEDYNFEDGSGLSRLNLITPATVIRLLRFMHASPHADAFRSLLPHGGVDGTLDDRFKRLKGAVIMAKTGSLSHTAALSGYIERPDRAPLAFSVMVNNANARGAALREFIDKLVLTILE